ncbi:MAG: MTH1187 family thiamine-binding protein [Pseudodesulfovibrio sp.]|nr:MTH1187 family thiamine-binding protein [Pseudodesulfovibrio sp.]
MSVIIDFTIFPTDKGCQGLSPYVARALDVVKKSGLPYILGPMGTSIEGEWDEVMAVVDACYRELDTDSDRIYLTIKADSRKGQKDRLSEKVQSVVDQQS